MGRGLSDLQIWILDRADRNADRVNENGRALDAAVTFEEIKIGFYKMPRSRTTAGWAFRKSRIARYNSVATAITKAAQRLVDRGLAIVIRGDDHAVNHVVVQLTSDGIQAAEAEAARRRSKLAKKP
jgi:hypothetical protein